MKHLKTVILSLSMIVGCGDGGGGASSKVVTVAPVSTDLQSDLWHDHRHVHDGVQLHDHDHASGFVGGHDHPHGHAHRHAETPLSGTVISLSRVATAGQVPGETAKIPPRLHLEVLAGLPDTLTVCLLTETADSGWSYWGDNLPEITVEIEVLGERFSLKCPKQPIPATKASKVQITSFEQLIPSSLRDLLVTGNSRVRISELSIYIGNSRFLTREKLSFKDAEISVSLE